MNVDEVIADVRKSVEKAGFHTLLRTPQRFGQQIVCGSKCTDGIYRERLAGLSQFMASGFWAALDIGNGLYLRLKTRFLRRSHG